MKLIGTLKSVESSIISLNNNRRVEIIVVDNNSNDETGKIVSDYKYSSGVEIKYVLEKNRGLSYARNRGIKEALGDVIIFTDDDIIVENNWIKEISKEMEMNNDIMLLCGRTFMYKNDQIPLSTKKSSERKEFQYPASPWAVGNGNNMVMKKSVIEKVGEFDVNMGAGTRIGSAEDTDYVYRILKNKYKAVYSPSAVAFHDHDRIKEVEVKKIKYNYAKGRGAFYAKYIIRGDIWVAKLLKWELQYYMKTISFKDSTWKQYILDIKGMIYGFLHRILYEAKNTMQISSISLNKYKDK
jgi:glycosyltransferase involved in cell wall biosynthesis